MAVVRAEGAIVGDSPIILRAGGGPYYSQRQGPYYSKGLGGRYREAVCPYGFIGRWAPALYYSRALAKDLFPLSLAIPETCRVTH